METRLPSLRHVSRKAGLAAVAAPAAHHAEAVVEDEATVDER
jgi:hypothetical protein